MAAAASASSSSSQTKDEYDVFISFRGADIRRGLLSHLHKALIEGGLEVFVDENLERGEEISSSLFEKIEKSRLSLVIFTENYAFSPWCLEELVKISDCMKRMGQIVLPIFYDIDPTHVQELTGTIGSAIYKHRKDPKISSMKVNSWRKVLKEIADLSGEDSQNSMDDFDLIKKIKEHILKKLEVVYPVDCDYSYNRNLVGIDSRIKKVESLLCLESEDVRVIGIWGKGGIGKTTTANAVFDRIHHRFPAQCNLLESIREKAEKSTPGQLEKEILSKVLGSEYSSSSLKRRQLSRKKALIVLDDVSDINQVELLMQLDKYGPGSRILMTSRDKQLLKNCGAEVHEVEELQTSESLKLFCLHAFKKMTVDERYERLSNRAVRYAQGLPLALKVLGGYLHGKSRQVWEDKLEKLQNTSIDRITKVLRISFDGLDNKYDKEIFLDIACFFKGKQRVYAEWILGTGSHSGIDHLVDMSLISISDNNTLEMHDLLQQMGKEIICEEEQVDKRRWLWDHKDICHVLEKIKGTDKIIGISLEMFLIKDLQSLKAFDFEGMDNLRILEFFGLKNIRVPEGLKSLPDELRVLRWYRCPLKSLPNSFCAENLIELDMRSSELKELWNGVQDLKNLKIIDLSKSKFLARIPDLSRALNLEVLRLSDCSSLEEIPSSFEHLSKLTELNLYGCFSLRSLPSCLNVESLMKLDLENHPKIEELPEFVCREGHARLVELDLQQCTLLQSLPDSICKLKCLEHLDISGCINLKGLPENLRKFSFLKRIYAVGSGIEYLPQLPSLDLLDVKNCTSLKSAASALPLVKEQKSRAIIFRFDNCINLGEEERNRMIDHVLQIPLTLPESTEFELWVPGSEVPGRMSNRKKGSSLLVKLYGRFSSVRGFNFAVVVDDSRIPNLGQYRLDYEITCMFADNTMPLGSPHRYSISNLNLQSKHLIIWGDCFNIPLAHKVFFHFFLVKTPTADNINGYRPLHCDAAIIECGVEPVFVDDEYTC